MEVLLLIVTVIPSIFCVDILPPNGEVCGPNVNFTCTVNGASLGWRYGGGSSGLSEFYLASDGITTDLRLLGSGPFRTRVTNVSGGVITSIATASDLTRDVNEMTLECSDGSFTSSGTEIKSVTLNLDPAASLSEATFESNGIRFSWIGTSCVESYRIFVNDELIDTVNETTYFYAPQSPGGYIFQVTSIDFSGRDIGSNSVFYLWQGPVTAYFLIESNSSGLIFTIKNGSDNFDRPPIIFCNVTLNGMTQDCIENGDIVPVFFNVSFRSSYTYSVNVFNVVGAVRRSGTLIFPSETTPSTSERTSTILSTSDEVTPAATSDEMSPSMIPTNGIRKISVDPAIFALPFIVLGVLIISSICWIILRICWKKQCCCPRIWKSSFWLIFFCYDCCTYDPEEKERNTIGQKNPNVVDEKGTDTPL